jgi:phage tail-like protein
VRGTVEGLASPHRLGATLPGLYQDDAFVQRMCEGLDAVLAPVVSTLDCLPAYLDPRTAPDDMLPWLALWVGLFLDGRQSPDRQRDLLSSAEGLQRRRGTALGLKAVVEAGLAVTAEIVESGATAWSSDPDHPLPGSSPQSIEVRVRPHDEAVIDDRRLDELVAGAKPAHVTHQVVVVPPD